MSKIAVFPGSFDPLTLGHHDIVMRALAMFDELVIGIGDNSEKKYLFSLEKRKSSLEKVFSSEKKVRVMTYSGLTVDFCKKIKASYILRGLRTSADFEFERGIAQMNKALAPEVETIFLMSRPEFSAITSTIVRDILKNGGDASQFVPSGVQL